MKAFLGSLMWWVLIVVGIVVPFVWELGRVARANR